MSHDFDDGVKSTKYYDTTWQDDSYPLPPAPNSGFATWTPDVNDKIYDIDGPTAGYSPSNTFDNQTYNNFRQYLQWTGDTTETASDYGIDGLWYYQARWQLSKNPQITLNNVATGSITLPDNPAP